jgi:hypothetical protein
VKVSLPNIATHTTPAKTLPGAGSISEKFSTLFAEAQDTGDGSSSDVLNSSGSRAAKKMSARSDKSGTKPASAQPGATPAKEAPVVLSTESKPALASMTLLSSIALQKESQTDDSDFPADSLATAHSDWVSPRAFQSPFALTDSSLVHASATATEPTHDTSSKTDSPDPAVDNQSTVISFTNLLGTWTAQGETSSLKSLIAPVAANSEASGTSNGKPATAATKTVSGDTARGTISALDAKVPAGFTFLQSHAPAPEMPKPVERPTSNSETKRETLQGRTLSGNATGKPEKVAARGFADAPNEDLNGASQEATQLGKANSPSSAAAHAVNSTPAPGSPLSAQASTPAVESHTSTAVAAAKTLDAPPHGASAAAAEDAETIREAAALAATSPLHAAKLVAGMERSELRMGLHAGEFGNVDIRTSLVRNQFTAEISVERGELGRALAAELPNLQHRLTEQQHLPSATITVQEHSTSGSSEFQQGSRQSQSAPPVNAPGSRGQEDSSPLVLPVEAMEATARLDIHM